MKRFRIASVFLSMVVGGGWVAAETAVAPKAAPVAAVAPPHDHEHGGTNAGGTMCEHMMAGGMGSGMGPMMGGGMGPMMMGGMGAKVSVKNVDKGVTITLTSPDAATAVRLQKMAEGMRLMHEAMNPEK